MSTLVEIEAAVQELAPEQMRQLLRFLKAQIRHRSPRPRARLVPGPNGTLLLEASTGAAPMTTQAVKQLLEDFP